MNSTESQVNHQCVTVEDEACLQAMQISSSLVLPMVLNAAIELQVFEIIGRARDGGISATDIASELPTKSTDAVARLDRMLCLLASHSLLTCSLREVEDGGRFERVYELTAVGRYFVRRGPEGSMAAMLALNSHRTSVEVWFRAKDVILEDGNQFDKAHGMPIFRYMDIDSTYNTIFNRAMADLSIIVMKQVLQMYQGFEGLNSLVDVAGGTGKCLDMIISKYPSISGINFDMPHVIKSAPSYPGIEHVGGDMFEKIPKAEAVMIKDALHNWNEECCIKVLKNCYEILPADGKVIVVNIVMPETPSSSTASKYITQLDNVMLTQLGSHERTQRQFESLCRASGFSKFQVTSHLAHSAWAIMEFFK